MTYFQVRNMYLKFEKLVIENKVMLQHFFCNTTFEFVFVCYNEVGLIPSLLEFLYLSPCKNTIFLALIHILNDLSLISEKFPSANAPTVELSLC